MDFSHEYKGFLIEPLVFPFPLGRTEKGRGQLNLLYQVAVRITDLKSSSSSVSRPPLMKGFSTLGDARRAAEIFGRGLVDAPPGNDPNAHPEHPASAQESRE